MVYLVGAGPGAPGLITAYGLELIKKCDTLIYDRLGTTGLLEYARPDSRRIYVGKAAGSHYRSQDEINEILVREGRAGGFVVRLKGGDPYVFGRGGEEAMALAAAGIPYEVVPGVTSAVAVPEACGIPVTHRGESRSFHVYTGHLGRDADDLSYVRMNEGTSIFLMGLSKLPDIVARLSQLGYDEHTPAAVISRGTLPGQKAVRGDLSDICGKVRAAELAPPAVIVVGANAALTLTSPDAGPLDGVHIGLVGTAKLREKMSMEISALGGTAYGIVDMEVVETPQKETLRHAVAHIEDYSWMAFTSQNTISLFFDWLREWRIDHRRLAHLRFAVVGAGTAELLGRYGYEADYVPEKFTTSALAEGLANVMTPGERLLLPRARQGSESMLGILDAGNVSYDEIPVYDVVGHRLDNMSYLPQLDVVMYVSASGVRGFANALAKTDERNAGGDLESATGDDGCGNGTSNMRETDNIEVRENSAKYDETVSLNAVSALSNVKVAALGRVTETALRDMGRLADIVPEVYDIEHLVSAVADYYASARQDEITHEEDTHNKDAQGEGANE